MVKGNKNATILVVGDYTGVGKSYLSMKLGEVFHTANNLAPFTIKNVGFFPEDFLDFVRHAKKYNAYVFDDAGLSIGSRDWYSETNKILTSVVESYRFLNLVVFITVPLRRLMDINIRELSNYFITVNAPGFGKCYELRHAHFAKQGMGQVYQYHMVDFSDVSLPSKELCEKYEKKKAEIMLENYAEQEERIFAKKERDRRMVLRSQTDDMIMDDIKANLDKYKYKNNINVDLIQHHSSIGAKRASHIKKTLKILYDVE